MQRFLLLLLAAPLACGMNEPAAPSAAPAVPPALAESAPPPVAPRAATNAAPAPTPAAEPAPPPKPVAEETVPKWVLENIGPQRIKLAQCYVAGLAKEPAMVGSVFLAAGIDREGKMIATPGPTGTVAPAVVSCVLGHLTKMRFTPPAGQAPIALMLPVHFHNNPVDGPSVTVGRGDPGY